MRRESKLKILGYSLAISLTGTPLVWAFNGIATDGSMGPAQVLSAPGVATNVNIPQSLGTTVGNNLFHSFSTFNIETGQTVTFKENITNSLANVISRVTGGSVSNLDGMLRSTPGGQADFYFINPAGIVFGANAQLDVAGAVHFSTADQLNFQDGGHYNATNPNASSLSSTAPSSFGFLGTSAANNGLIEFNGTQFSTKYGQTIESQKLDVVAEHIKIENSAKLKLPFGEIRLVAMQGQGQVDLQPTAYDHLPLPDSSLLNANGGDIVITDSSLLTTSLESGQGRVALWGGNVSIINSTLRADGYGNLDELPEQGIIIQSASLGVDSSIIHTESHGSGKAGALALTSTGNLNIVNGSTISTATSGGGDAGGLSIQAGSAILDGNANNTTRIGSDVLAGSIGNGGLVTVATPGSMELLNNAQISSTTTGQGDAGNISIQAESLKLDGSAGNGSPSIQSSAWSSGNAGSVKIIVGNGIEILADKVSQASNHDSILIPQDEGASISSYTLGSGNTGNVTVTANSMAINGFGNTSSRNGIFASTKKGSIGNAGVVSVEIVGDLNIFNSGFISSSTEGSGTSDGINVRAGNIHIDGTSDQNNTGILSASRDGTGNAGSVSVESINSISLFNGGLISTSSLGAGDAGNVRVKAESLVIDGSGFGLSTDNQVSVGIYATKVSPSLGRAGNISVETFGDLKLFNNGEISSSTYGSGLAGDIYVKAGNIEIDGKLSQNANISSDTYGEFGRAGTVKVESSGFISLSNGGFISSSSYSQGDAGNVSVKANSLIINGLGVQSFQESQANFTITGIFAAALPGSTGKAGSVSVDTVGNLKILDSGFISSSTWGLGAAGDVNVKAGNIQIEGRGGPNETGISSAALPLSGARLGVLR